MLSKKHIPKCKPAHKTVGGLIVPKYFFAEDKCLGGLSYTPNPDDIFVVTYPKSGTTWAQYIVWEILNFGAPPPGLKDMMNKCVPFLEATGPDPVQKLSPPRPIKTHLPFHLQPYHHFAKYIYIARNVKDTCISYYNHVKEMSSVYKFSDGTLEDFFEYFIDGELGYGDWFNHVLSWYVHKDDPNVLFLTYEKMKRDPEGTVLKIAQFIGDKYHEKLASDPSLLSRILEYTSFVTMKKLEFYMPNEASDAHDGEFLKTPNEQDLEKFHKVNFFWRGKVGNWKEHLSVEQVERLDSMVLSRPRGPEIFELCKE